MKNDSINEIALAEAFICGTGLKHYITMFATLGGAIANGRVPRASSEEIDKTLRIIVREGQLDADTPKYTIECAEFLQMLRLRQTKRDIPQ